MKNINLLVNQFSIQKPGNENVPIQNFMMSGDKYNEIFIGNGIGYLEYTMTFQLIQECMKKLNSNGKLIIRDIDICIVGTRVSNGSFKLDVLSNLLKNRASFHSIYSLSDFAIGNNYLISSKEVENVEFELVLKNG